MISFPTTLKLLTTNDTEGRIRFTVKPEGIEITGNAPGMPISGTVNEADVPTVARFIKSVTANMVCRQLPLGNGDLKVFSISNTETDELLHLFLHMEEFFSARLDKVMVNGIVSDMRMPGISKIHSISRFEFFKLEEPRNQGSMGTVTVEVRDTFHSIMPNRKRAFSVPDTLPRYDDENPFVYFIPEPGTIPFSISVIVPRAQPDNNLEVQFDQYYLPLDFNYPERDILSHAFGTVVVIETDKRNYPAESINVRASLYRIPTTQGGWAEHVECRMFTYEPHYDVVTISLGGTLFKLDHALITGEPNGRELR